MGISIKKFSQKANVSISTISRAINRPHMVTRETRERILKLAEKFNYIPNIYASKLRNQISRTIAVIIPNLDDDVYINSLRAIEKRLRDGNYHVLLRIEEIGNPYFTKSMQELDNGRVDGILAAADIFKETATLPNLSIPIVTFCCYRQCEHALKNEVKSRSPIDEGVKKLLSLRCKRLGFLYDGTYPSSTALKDAFKRSLLAHQIDIDGEWIMDFSDFMNKLNEKGTSSLRKDLDGIMLSNAAIAIKLVRSIQDSTVVNNSTLRIAALTSDTDLKLLLPDVIFCKIDAVQIGLNAAEKLIGLIECVE